VLELCTDDDAPPGDVVGALAELLLDLAEQGDGQTPTSRLAAGRRARILGEPREQV
jgi:hypothetical protein